MRGRPEKEIVRIHEQEENSTRVAPLNEKQLERAGLDPSEDVYTKREVHEGSKKITLNMSNDKSTLENTD